MANGTVPITRVGLDPESSLCTTGHPANIMTGVLLRLLQEHFANPGNLEYNGSNEFVDAAGLRPRRQLEGYVWNRDNTRTQIQIQPVWKYNTQDLQRRPAIYVKRNAMRPQRIAIDDGGMVRGSRKDEDGNTVAVDGASYAKLLIGSHTVFSVGHTGAEAELIGQEVFNHLVGFSPIIRRDLKLHRFEVMEMGEASPLKEFENHFVVPVVLGYGIGWAWTVYETAPWLKSVSVDVRAEQA